ncbi:MAG: hypothetical protein H7240_08975 [Glaciimonas sp.]|nr:hypothetical protein [Glaciimonas sp.]
MIMITKSAENKNNFALNLIFTDSARTAWGHILAGVAAAKPPVVLMPAYIGFTEREGSGVLIRLQKILRGINFTKLMIL